MVGKLEPPSDAPKRGSTGTGNPCVCRRSPRSEGSGRGACFSEEGDPNDPGAFLVGEIFRLAVEFRGSLESLSRRSRPSQDQQPLPLVLPESPLSKGLTGKVRRIQSFRRNAGERGPQPPDLREAALLPQSPPSGAPQSRHGLPGRPVEDRRDRIRRNRFGSRRERRRGRYGLGGFRDDG